MAELLLLLFTALCLYNTGVQWGMQLAHYPLYSSVPPEAFRAYMARQNRRQIAPSIAPGVLQLLCSLALPFVRPPEVATVLVVLSVVVNLAVVVVTAVWSGRYHRLLERDGYDRAVISRLVVRNWSRTALYTAQAVLVLSMTYQILG